MISPSAYRFLRKLRRDERGTLVTEFAVTLPILLVFLFGFMGMGQLLWYHHIITEGVRDGTRYLSRIATPTADPYLTRAKNLAMMGVTGSSGPLFYFWTDPDSITVEETTIANPDGTAFREIGAVPVVRMTASVNVSLPVLGFVGINPSIVYTVVDEARWIGR